MFTREEYIEEGQVCSVEGVSARGPTGRYSW